MLREFFANPLVLYVALPVVGVPLVLGIAFWRSSAGGGMSTRAARWALVAAGLAFVVWTLAVVQRIAVSGSSTAFLAITWIGLPGMVVAALTFLVAWGVAVCAQWVWVPSRRRAGDPLPLSLAWLVVVLAGGAGTSLVYSMHLRRIAVSDAAPSRLRDLSRGWWTRRDAGVRELLASNPRTPADVLAELAWDPAIRPVVAANPATPPAQLERMYLDPGTRVGLAENASTPVEVLRRLAIAPDADIRWALVGNEALPDDMLADLAHDPEVGSAAARVIRRRAEGPRWILLAPPYTWHWRNPFRRVLDDSASQDVWGGVAAFETEDACEALRTESVRRETRRRRSIQFGEFPADLYSHTRCAFVQR